MYKDEQARKAKGDEGTRGSTGAPKGARQLVESSPRQLGLRTFYQVMTAGKTVGSALENQEMRFYYKLMQIDDNDVAPAIENYCGPVGWVYYRLMAA